LQVVLCKIVKMPSMHPFLASQTYSDTFSDISFRCPKEYKLDQSLGF
jgi:hypothetical protein